MTMNLAMGTNGHPSPEDARTTPSVLSKAHLLLDAFASGPTTIGLTQLSRRSGVSKASAHRLASELVELGLLARVADGYQLGWRIFELGELVAGPARLRAVAKPTLMDLRSVTRAVVHLAVPQGEDCVYLERFAGRREAAQLASIGTRVPMYTSASGRLFLAYGDPGAASHLSDQALHAFGVRRQEDVPARLEAMRDRRLSEDQQCVVGFKTIAAPIFHAGLGQIVAAVSITVEANRRDEKPLTHALWAAANDIGHGLDRHRTTTRFSRPRLVG